MPAQLAHLIARLRFRLRALLWPERVAREIDTELSEHLRQHENELVRAGVDSAEARSLARRELGDLDRIRSRCREISDLPVRRARKGPVDMLTQDARYAFRSLSRRPGFTLVAAATLALGIAATTTMFSLVDGIVLRQLPYPEPEQLVVPTATSLEQGSPFPVSYPEFEEWGRQSDVFAGLAATAGTTRDLTGDGEPERLPGLAASEDYFRVFAADPVVGRLFDRDDYGEGTFRVVVLGKSFWERRFGADPDVVGQEIRLSDNPYTVIGVVDEASVWPTGPEIWVPLWYGDPLPDFAREWDNYFLRVVGRLQPGVDVATADAYVAGMARRLVTEMPQERAGTGGAAYALRDWIVDDDLRTGLVVLLGAVGFVLLIACVNVANLLLARAAERDREIAVRRALGASRGDLLRQTLSESVLLAGAGGLLGVSAAIVLTRVVVATLPADTPRLAEVGLSPGVLLFASLASLATAFVFGTLPAIEASRGDLTGALRESSRGATGGRRVQRARAGLVVAEVVLSLVLLVAAGLMFRSLDGLLERDAGVSLDDVLAARVTLPRARYTADDAVGFFLETQQRLAALPSVRSAAAAFVVPLGTGGLYRAHLAEGAPEPPEGPELVARWNSVTPGYFSTVGIPMLAGRDFSELDRQETELTVVVSDSFARRMFPGENPIGKRLRSWRDENVLRTIIGVVGDVRMRGMDTDYEDVVYVSALQSNIQLQGFVVRADGDPMAVAGAVRETIWNQDPDLPVTEMGLLRTLADRSVSDLASFGRLMGIFAALALALASIGLYGVVSWSVAQRGREYGIRQALGASGRDIVGAVVRGALGLVGVGLAIGSFLSLGLTRVMDSLLPGVTGTDPLTYVTVGGMILAVTLAASVVPALRATRVDPVESLRAE